MNSGRTSRRVGAIGLIVGGLVAACVVLAQFAVQSSFRTNDDFASIRAASLVVSVLNVVGSLVLVAAFAVLAVSRGRSGVFGGSILPRVGFVVLAVVFGLAQLFFLTAPLVLSATASTLIVPANRVVNFLVIAGLVFAAIAVLLRSAFGGFARFVLLLPVAVLLMLQLPLPLPYPAYLLPQAVFQLAWVVVGISYLLARPRGATVTAASENLAE